MEDDMNGNIVDADIADGNDDALGISSKRKKKGTKKKKKKKRSSSTSSKKRSTAKSQDISAETEQSSSVRSSSIGSSGTSEPSSGMLPSGRPSASSEGLRKFSKPSSVRYSSTSKLNKKSMPKSPESNDIDVIPIVNATPIVGNENATPNILNNSNATQLPQDNSNRGHHGTLSVTQTQTANMNVNLVTMLPGTNTTNDSGSYYLGDEEEGSDDREQPKRAKRSKNATRNNLRTIIGTIICCIVVVMVIVMVLVFTLRGGDSGDSVPLEPGTIACQEDEVCRNSETHLDYWNATGCLGVIHCEDDFAPEDLLGNETLQKACDSTMEAGTQACHDNIICKRQESHVKFIVDGRFENGDGDTNACKTTFVPTPAPTTAPTRPAQNPVPTPVLTSDDGIIVQTDEFNSSPVPVFGKCPTTNGLQTTMIGLRCEGESCRNVRMTCSNSGTLQVGSTLWESDWFSWFSNGNDIHREAECPQNSVITQLGCRNNGCSWHQLLCQELISVALDYNNCSETPIFPSAVSQTGYEEIPAGAYAVGLRCNEEKACAQKAIRYCYPLASGSDNGALVVKTDEFYSDGADSVGKGECQSINGLQTTMIGLSCAGQSCSNLTMTCHNSGALQVDSATWSSEWFSDEPEENTAECPQNSVITQLECRGWFCDEHRLVCQELISVTLDYSNCAETAILPAALHEVGYREIPKGAFAVAMRCNHEGWCGQKAIRYCYPWDGIVMETDEFTSLGAPPMRGECPNINGLQTTMIGLRCAGKSCSNLTMTCHNSGTVGVSSGIWSSEWFSEEADRNTAECPQNSVITQLGCRWDRCDDHQLVCQELISVTLDYNKCAITRFFPSVVDETGNEEIPVGAFAVGMRCSGRGWCAQKAIRYCYPLAPGR